MKSPVDESHNCCVHVPNASENIDLVVTSQRHFLFIPWRFTSATACYRLLLDVIPLILPEKGKQKSTPLRRNPPQIQYINIYRKWIISTGNTNNEPTWHTRAVIKIEIWKRFFFCSVLVFCMQNLLSENWGVKKVFKESQCCAIKRNDVYWDTTAVFYYPKKLCLLPAEKPILYFEPGLSNKTMVKLLHLCFENHGKNKQENWKWQIYRYIRTNQIIAFVISKQQYV